MGSRGGYFAEELKQEKVLIIEEAPMTKLMRIVGVYTCKKFGRFGFKTFRWNFSFIRKFKPKGQILRLPVERVFGGNLYFLDRPLRMPTDSFHSHIFFSWPYSRQIPLGILALKIFWRPLRGVRTGLGRQKYRKIAHFCHFYTKFSPFSPLNSIWMQDNARFY